MKKIIAVALAALMIIGMFAGCSTAAKSEAAASLYTLTGKYKDTKLTTVTEGKLTIAISPDFAPMEFVDPTKTGQEMFVGFDVILSKYIAEELGLELVIMPMDFSACQTAVYTGAVDMSISGYSWSEEREANYNLSDYYYAGENENEQVLITLASNGDKYATAKALAGAKIGAQNASLQYSLVGAKVGAQNASLQQSLVEAQLPDSELILFTDLGTAVLQLKSGDFDCIAVADGNGTAIIAKNPEIAKSGFVFYVDPKETGNVIMLQKGADDLTAVVNQILADSQQYWDAWYTHAESISGIDQSYDESGNAIT